MLCRGGEHTAICTSCLWSETFNYRPVKGPENPHTGVEFIAAEHETRGGGQGQHKDTYILGGRQGNFKDFKGGGDGRRKNRVA